MTQEDWSGIGETVEPLSVDSQGESSTAQAANETWGDAAIGDVTSDLATRRARINGQDSLAGGRSHITALVPLGD